MYCISISHKNANVDIRKKFAFDESQKQAILNRLLGKSIQQAVVLCTCNRTELYFCGNKQSNETVLRTLSEESGLSVTEMRTYILSFEGDKTLRHLYRVACGIESMAIGEDEILGQMKNAYAFSVEQNAVGYEMNTVFQSAFACAKKIKTHTAMSKSSVSTATLASNEAARWGEQVRVVLIGATGKIGSIVLKNLVSHKNIHTVATIRQHHHLEEYVTSVPNAELAVYGERYRYFDEADCVISATASPHYTITFDKLKKSLTTHKPRLFIDLAVPQDIDSEIEKLDGVRLMNIDHFEELAKHNNEMKLSSVETAKEMINTEIDELKKSMIFHHFLPQMQETLSRFVGKPESLIYTMRDQMTAEQFEAFIRILEE